MLYKVCIINLLLGSYGHAGRKRLDSLGDQERCFHFYDYLFLSGLKLCKPQQMMS